jgi:hypothetical protein
MFSSGIKNIILFCSAIFIIGSADAQAQWRLKRDQSGVKIYMRTSGRSSFNELKAEITIEATLSELAALILDVPNHTRWVYSVKTCYLLKKIADNELYYYEVVDSPFPASDRDLIVHTKIVQDPESRVMTVIGIEEAGYMPPKRNIVRVPVSTETWKVIPAGNNMLRIEYYLEIDPGGSVPAWLLNSFAEKGPFETFRHLQAQVENPKYRNASFSFIKD